MYNLTDEQANLLKDVLKTISSDKTLTARMAKASGHSFFNFDIIADNAFRALGNGRLTVETQ